MNTELYITPDTSQIKISGDVDLVTSHMQLIKQYANVVDDAFLNYQ